MSSSEINCSDRMGLVDSVHFAFDSKMSTRTEIISQEVEREEKIISLSQEI